MALDRFGQLKPAGRNWRKVRSRRLARTCPFSPDAANEDEIAAAVFPDAVAADPFIGRYEAAYIGHAEENDFRAQGSSGGLVTWTAAELLRTGVVDAVAHVEACVDPSGERLFNYRISRDMAGLRSGSKSRYHPVELSEVIRTIAAQPGRYAIVGVPCFIKAIQLLRREDPVMAERVVMTLGLFCGHAKSARLVESFAWQMATPPARVTEVDFREKDEGRPANWYVARLGLADGEPRRRDWWSMADGDWGAGFFQNSACDFCDDVVAETADVSFGDAWIEPYASDWRGSNVVVVRSAIVGRLLQTASSQGRIRLTTVDAATVHATQAAGFRQRREGLALRLSRWRGPLRPRKRVDPSAPRPPARRRAVYALRRHIARWSHRIFFTARLLRAPWLYLAWARTALRLYQGVTYSRGRIGAVIDRLEKHGIKTAKSGAA